MKIEDKIVELLSEMLVNQDRIEAWFVKLAESHERLVTIQERQEKILIKILEVLSDDVPKFDELIEMDQLGGKKVVLRKTK